MAFDPYIHFQGNCRAAMEAYRDLFGGTLQIMTYGQMPDAPEGGMSAISAMPPALSVIGP